MTDGHVNQQLGTYRAKRDFGVTPEPSGDDPAGPDDQPRFVVQEHHARRLHWDFRLERNGVLVSWALPKGVPPDPKVNHLAVPTEDHPLSYATFVGEIPKGNYGAGKVTLWDHGTYECLKWDEREVQVVLHGARVHGRYVLFRTGDRQWMIHRMDPPEDPARQPLPLDLEPMMATPGPLPADDQDYGFEILWDGTRTLAYARPGDLRFKLPFEPELEDPWPEVRPLSRALGSREAVLDAVWAPVGGEDQSALMIFDVLHLDGHPTLSRPYEERRRRLEELALEGPAWQTPAYHVGDGEALLGLARQRGLGGVVAKRLNSVYAPGVVSPDWIAIRATA